MAEWLQFYFEQLDRFIIGATILTFIVHQVVLICQGHTAALEGAFLKSLTAAGVPNGIAFIICSFVPTYVAELQGSTLAFVLAGLALLSVSMKDLFRLYKA